VFSVGCGGFSVEPKDRAISPVESNAGELYTGLTPPEKRRLPPPGICRERGKGLRKKKDARAGILSSFLIQKFNTQ
jgi:hypothetical protein